MELSPKSITGVQFRTVRKGYDPEEVRGFLSQLARGVEALQAQTAATESRARSMMTKLQELSSREDPDPSETMKRTLLLAQRTADAAVAEANTDARNIVTAAEDKARTTMAEAQAKAEQMVIDAEADARRAGSVEKARIEAEVAVLTARRDELHTEATRLESHVRGQRERLNATVATLTGVLAEGGSLVPTELAPPTPSPEPDPADRGDSRGWDDPPGTGLADDLALLADPHGDGGPPTAEVPVISGDDELVRGFFDPEPYADDRWKGRRVD